MKRRSDLCWSTRILVVALLLTWLKSELQAISLYSEKMPSGVVLRGGERFDYIVVGAGAAGAAAAARLSLAGAGVLLVEAGGDPNLISKIPGVSLALLGSDIDWKYETISNNVSCLASMGRQCRFSRGKCLGGSTTINYMLHTRGCKKDFDDIPVPGWSYEDLMSYFLKYEGLQDLDLLPPSSRRFHNTTGTMRMEFFKDSENPWHSRLKKSYQALGFTDNPDINAESQIGVSKMLGYVYDGQRMSTARAYLTRNDVKKRLKVAKNTMCTGVIIDREKVTRGITVVQDSKKLNIYARREVILSAGTIGSPQILMLSGIGPSKHLKNLGIPVKVDQPSVGANMTDHILPLVLVLVDKGTGIEDDLMNLATKTKQVGQLLMEGSGPLTSNGLIDLNAFANSQCYDFHRHKLGNESFDGSDCALPDLQVIHSYIDRQILRLVRPYFKRALNYNDYVVNQISKVNEKHAIIVISPVLLHPRSVGHVRLASADPLARPAIFPNYLSDERDANDLVRFIRIIEDLMMTKSFRQRNASIFHVDLPGCPSVDNGSEGYWQCYVRHMTYGVFHATGTCALGGVLDARLRVRGVRRLRVADLSVLPTVPRGNTAAVAIAIGERVADFILQER